MTATSATVQAGSAKAWLMASRPATLLVGAVPVAVGTAVAHAQGGLQLGPALAALLGALLIQIGTNFANDLFDHEKGADTAERVGPTRVTQAGLLSPGAVRAGMVASFGLATLSGLYLVWAAGPAVVAIGVASVAAGVLYTGGPWPLGYHGLGDLFVMIFFGFVAVCGTAFVQMGSVPMLSWAASIPVGALATAVLVVNNVRDAQTDVVAGKRTLAVRFGRNVAAGEYALLVASAYLVPAALWAAGFTGPKVLLTLLSMPLAIPMVRAVYSEPITPAFNRHLGGTARLMTFHGALLVAGLW